MVHYFKPSDPSFKANMFVFLLTVNQWTLVKARASSTLQLQLHLNCQLKYSEMKILLHYQQWKEL